VSVEGNRGILGWGAYLPYRRLDRTEIPAVAGVGGGKGTRTVASYDEDATTMGVEAARAARRRLPSVAVDAVWFSTVEPTYLDKTNAVAIHAALDLDGTVGAYDAVGSVRSGMGALRTAMRSSGAALVVTSDLRTGQPGSEDEASGGDGATALVVGGPDDGAVLASFLGWGSATEEFVDRWRQPGNTHSLHWDERFGETKYVPLGAAAFEAALKDVGLTADAVDHLIVTGTHDRAAASTARALGVDGARLADSLAATVGNTGAAHPALLLASVLEQATPGQVVALVVLADGADAVLLRTTDAIDAPRSGPTVAEQVASGGPVPYGRFLAWRGWLQVEPPRRPPPARPSASAAGRSTAWKFGFVGSADDAGEIHLPPSPLDAQRRPMADAVGTIATFTVDRLAYSPSPPVVFAVVDFDGGGRLPVELTDVDVDEVAVGRRVRMTFRRLFTADGIANYFWKGTLLRDEVGQVGEEART
jgi:hydroxymethylglutaryl-CoA synthase